MVTLPVALAGLGLQWLWRRYVVHEPTRGLLVDLREYRARRGR